MINWKQVYCQKANYFFRSNDDAIVNLITLHKFVTEEEKRRDPNVEKIIYGHVLPYSYAMRNEQSKWLAQTKH